MSDNLYNLVLDVRERLRFMSEIGIDTMSVELSERTEAIIAQHIPKLTETISNSSDLPVSKTVSEPQKARRPAGSRLAELPSLSARPLPVRPNTETTRPDHPVTPASGESITETVASPQAPSIMAIRAEIGECVRCPLHEGRTQIVHSTGNFAARLMFVGEAPGADEDAEGKPFVGRAGKLLTDIIIGMGFRREDVFIGNINRCRPPGNRQPLPIETEACRPFLLREVEVIKPKVIVVLGNTATQNLLSIKTPISKIRGQFQDYFGVKVMPTFHPAYLLRDPHKKREVWEDMKKVRDYINSIPQ